LFICFPLAPAETKSLRLCAAPNMARFAISGPANFLERIAPLTLDITCLFQLPVERAKSVRVQLRRCAAEEPNHRPRRLLRARRHRPRRRHAGEKADDLASLQLIKLYPIPRARSAVQDTELTRISQEGVGPILQPISRC